MTRKKARSLKLTLSDRIFHTLNYLFLGFCMVIVLFPLINVVSQSISSPAAVSSGKIFLLPIDVSFEAYITVLHSPMIIYGFFNTILYAFFGTLLNIILTMMAAYPLSRKEFVGRGWLTLIFTFTMLFSGGMIPQYLLVKNLGLIDNRLVMILPKALSVWNMILARTYLQNTIPQELYDATEIDGANDTDIILKIVIPLSKPIIAVLCLFYAVGHWNTYFDAMIYLNTQKLFNLQLVLRNIFSNIAQLYEQNQSMADAARAASFAEVLKYAVIVVASLPVMMIYPFVQKHFVKGIMIGTLKG